MFKNLETYLEEISHFLSGREEREEILSEIRSHILEKAEQESVPVSETSLEMVIAAYGKPRQVAEKYLDGRPIIDPAFKRHFFRYASIFFAIHLVFIFFAVIFKNSFIIFPLLFIPRLGVIEAIMYLPTAFLTDFGIVALVLYFITQSGREFKLPWPKLALDLDEVQAPAVKTLAAKIAHMVGAGIMLALTGMAITLFKKFQTIFIISFNFEKFRPLFMPAPGRRISLVVIIMLAVSTATLFIKLLFPSRRLACWVDAINDTISLVLIGVVLHLQYTDLFAVHIPPALLPWVHYSLTITLLIIALVVAINLVTNLIRIGRKRLVK